MSIRALVGVPGSGKSLHAMDEIYYASLRKSSLIITNFDVNWPRHARCSRARVPSGELNVADLIDAVRVWLEQGHRVTREGQILVVIDEAQIPFSNRDWNKKGRDEWIRLFILHRKVGMRFLLIVQDIGMIDKQIRANVESIGYHTLINSYGWFGRLVHVLGLGRPFSMCVWRLPFYGASKASIVGRDLVIGRRRIYRMYDTHTMFGDDLGLGEIWG